MPTKRTIKASNKKYLKSKKTYNKKKFYPSSKKNKNKNFYNYMIFSTLKLANFWHKLCSKTQNFNTKIYATNIHPGSETHISLTRDDEFITKYKQIILDNPMVCTFKITDFILFKTKSKGPYRPPWFKENSDYPLIWFTAMTEITSINFKYKTKQNFDIDLIRNMTYGDNKPHITLSLLALKGDPTNKCNLKIGYNTKEEKIILKPHKSNPKQLNQLIKQMNKYKNMEFTGYTDIDENEFLAYFIKKDKLYKLIEKDSINILNYIFKNIIT